MAIALAFIVFIGTYVTQESSYDTFVGDDVYVASDSDSSGLSGTLKGSVEGRCPDIEAISRLIGLKSLSGMEQSVTIGDETMAQNALCVDSSFMSLIPIPMAVGDRNSVLETISSVIVSQSFADKWFPEGNAETGRGQADPEGLYPVDPDLGRDPYDRGDHPGTAFHQRCFKPVGDADRKGRGTFLWHGDLRPAFSAHGV